MLKDSFGLGDMITKLLKAAVAPFLDLSSSTSLYYLLALIPAIGAGWLIWKHILKK